VDVLGIILVLVLVALAGRYLYRRSPKQRERRAIKALMLACGGDQELAERLIFAEMERQQDIGFGEAALRARRRLSRDRR
jgi:hypothetical protein